MESPVRDTRAVTPAEPSNPLSQRGGPCGRLPEWQPDARQTGLPRAAINARTRPHAIGTRCFPEQTAEPGSIHR